MVVESLVRRWAVKDALTGLLLDILSIIIIDRLSRFDY